MVKSDFAELSKMETGGNEGGASSSDALDAAAASAPPPAALKGMAGKFGKKKKKAAAAGAFGGGGGGDALFELMATAGVAAPKKLAISGEEKKSKWGAIKRELVETGVGQGGGGGLSETQKEILAMGKEAWVKKIESARTIRKMSGLVAIAMSFGTAYYAAEIFVIVDHSTEKPRLVRMLVFATVVWACATLLFLLRQCASAERNDAELRSAKRALDDRDRRRAAERASPRP